MRRLIVAGLVATACTGGEGGGEIDSLPADTGAAVAQALTDPAPPTAARGQLAANSAGPITFQGAWIARAGECRRPPSLQVLVQEQLDGMILLLALPESGSRLTTYPVMVVDSGIPAGPAAQAAVERIVRDRPASWQAHEGSVTLTAWDQDRVSGTFALTMRDINSDELSKVAGSFLGVPVIALPEAQCFVADSAS